MVARDSDLNIYKYSDRQNVNDMLNDLLIEDKFGSIMVPSTALRVHGMAHEGGCKLL